MEIKNNFTETLQTERLILTPWQRKFAKDMYKNWATDPEVNKWLSWELHKNVEETEQLILNWMASPRYNWCIVDKQTGEAIGSIDMVRISEKDYKGEIGYCLTRRYWNKGLMTEALKKVIEFLFSEGFNKLELRHAVENIGSGRVMQKAGMTFLCTSPKDCYVRGQFYDTNNYYILNPNIKH